MSSPGNYADIRRGWEWKCHTPHLPHHHGWIMQRWQSVRMKTSFRPSPSTLIANSKPEPHHEPANASTASVCLIRHDVVLPELGFDGFSSSDRLPRLPAPTSCGYTTFQGVSTAIQSAKCRMTLAYLQTHACTNPNNAMPETGLQESLIFHMWPPLQKTRQPPWSLLTPLLGRRFEWNMSTAAL